MAVQKWTVIQNNFIIDWKVKTERLKPNRKKVQWACFKVAQGVIERLRSITHKIISEPKKHVSSHKTRATVQLTISGPKEQAPGEGAISKRNLATFEPKAAMLDRRERQLQNNQT